jgi:hypothetical protein
MESKIMNDRGTFILSLDFELAWGSFDKGISKEKIYAIQRTRSCIDEVLKLFEKYNISATWATVGHLMLHQCETVDGVKHPNLIRPSHDWYNKDWFHEDPATTMDENSMWYAADVISKIKNCTVTQEIGSHSFSHIIFGDKGCSKESAESDIQEAVRVANENNIHLSSFVFPRNSVGHLDILKHYGFKCYRGNGNEWYKGIKSKRLRKISHIFDELFSITPNTTKISMDDTGLYNIRGNMLYLSRDGIRKYIPMKSRVNKAKKGIDKAIERGEIFHLWFHPFNLGTDPSNLIKGLEEILVYVKHQIDNDKLENLTMIDTVKKYT